MPNALINHSDTKILAVNIQKLQQHIGGKPDVAIILGSGLHPVADGLGVKANASFSSFGLPEPSVAGHPGQIADGVVSGKKALVFLGRSHLYEGASLNMVTASVRLAVAAGAGLVILSNAAGGLAPDMHIGDLMLIEDHISLPGLSGYPGAGAYPWPQFVALDGLYDHALLNLAYNCGQELGLPIKRGVYAMVHGHTYETPAERRLLRLAGASAVGMSTVPEAIAAHAAKSKVLAISTITNVADQPNPPTHEEVARVSRSAAQAVAQLLSCLLSKWQPE